MPGRTENSQMTEPTDLTLAQARDALADRQFTAVELTRGYLAAMERARALNCFVAETPERALAMAAASDERIAKREALPLDGLPIGIKDLYATQGVHTQACSHILDGFKPAYESFVTARLWRDGAVLLGKLNMDEFAMGSSNETSYYGPVVSPWLPPNWSVERARAALGDDKNGLLVPGGSSGGSAAAVAARLCVGATATDTGGSIRQPAAFTGTVGIKPTYGRCSRWGIVAFASSLDQAGPIARDVRDAAILLRSMAGYRCQGCDLRRYRRCPTTRRRSAGRSRARRSAFRRNIGSTACRPRSSSSWAGVPAMAGATPGPRSSTFRCRTPNTRCPPITSWRRPRPPPTSPAMTACATACACRGR